MKKKFLVLIILGISFYNAGFSQQSRTRESFDEGWKFFLGDDANAKNSGYDDASWRILNLPHDWSIEGPFDEKNPAGIGGGALPGGTGWYRKSFTIPASSKGKNVFIDFDGVYRLSEVWINGHDLGIRPNGYISFRYDLTSYLNYGGQKNEIAVRVDNSQQPNSRWYSGSGIYRHVWLETTNKTFVDLWGTFITTSKLSSEAATITINIKVKNSNASNANADVKTILYDADSKVVGNIVSPVKSSANSAIETTQKMNVTSPLLWSVDRLKEGA